jgi:transcriptional regulator with XRE-family HTH domain
VPTKKVRRVEAERFGRVVRDLRESKGLTQEELADRAGISATYVGFIERGDSVPTLTVILEIADGLGVRAAELLRDF